MAITREEVLHVARLARLELSEDEVERFRRAALGDPRGRLEGVRARPLRRAADLAPARDRERLGRGRAAPVPDARRGVRERARPRRRLLPDPAGMTSDDRHAAPVGRGGARPARARRGLGARALGRLPRARSTRANDELNAYLTLVDEPAGDGVPIALKDVISTKGIRTTAGSKILENYVPVFDSTVAAHCKAAGLPRAREDEHRRVRDGLLDRELGLRADAQPVGPHAASRAARAAARRPRSRRASRPGRSAPTPAARSSCRRRSAATSGCGRPTAPSRATGSSPSPRASTRSAR